MWEFPRTVSSTASMNTGNLSTETLFRALWGNENSPRRPDHVLTSARIALTATRGNLTSCSQIANDRADSDLTRISSQSEIDYRLRSSSVVYGPMVNIRVRSRHRNPAIPTSRFVDCLHHSHIYDSVFAVRMNASVPSDPIGKVIELL